MGFGVEYRIYLFASAACGKRYSRNAGSYQLLLYKLRSTYHANHTMSTMPDNLFFFSIYYNTILVKEDCSHVRMARLNIVSIWTG